MMRGSPMMFAALRRTILWPVRTENLERSLLVIIPKLKDKFRRRRMEQFPPNPAQRLAVRSLKTLGKMIARQTRLSRPPVR
jgi:hypothetical protein